MTRVPCDPVGKGTLGDRWRHTCSPARLADALKISVDELVGCERLKEAQAPRNARLWRKLREIEKLGEADRKAVLRFVDALLAKQRLEHQRG